MEPSQDLSQDPFEAFSHSVREDVDGLIWLGHLEDHFSFCGHDFAIRTLRGDEELLAALVMKEFVETLGQAKAHVWSTICLAIVAIDGAEDFCPQATPNKRDYARARFQWLTSNWYWPVALAVYNHYNALLERQQEALTALEDFCSGSLPPLTPFASSSIDRASSEVPGDDIRDYLEPPEDSAPSS